jgi:hypothetical protein
MSGNQKMFPQRIHQQTMPPRALAPYSAESFQQLVPAPEHNQEQALLTEQNSPALQYPLAQRYLQAQQVLQTFQNLWA